MEYTVNYLCGSSHNNLQNIKTLITCRGDDVIIFELVLKCISSPLRDH